MALSEREGLPLDVGRARRLVSERLRRALQARDGGCRFPGCPVPVRRTQAHHVQHWAEGGRTDLANLVALCRFHHRRLHEGAYRIRREGGRGGGDGLRFETPEGSLIGPLPRPPLDPATGGSAHLRRRCRERGLVLQPWTPWARDGSPCDPATWSA